MESSICHYSDLPDTVSSPPRVQTIAAAARAPRPHLDSQKFTPCHHLLVYSHANAYGLQGITWQALRCADTPIGTGRPLFPLMWNIHKHNAGSVGRP